MTATDEATATEARALGERYGERSVAPGARGAIGARLTSRGLARVGPAWWPFRSRETTLPTHGYHRETRIACGLRIVDSWVAGRARRTTTLFGRGLHPALVGPDLARADLAHAALSAMWVPSVLLPSGSVHWTAEDRDVATVAFAVAGTPVWLRMALHRGGLPRSIATVRWSDPGSTGFYRDEPYGAEFFEHHTFGGLTVPSTGVIGWGVGGEGARREVLRFQLTALDPITVDATLPDLPEHAGTCDAAEGELSACAR